MNAGGLGPRVARLTVMDIDGVLADVRHRLHYLASSPKQWDAFFAACGDDAVLMAGLEAAREARLLVYFSGRPERYRSETLTWLRDGDFPEAPLHLRPDRDHRPARDYKPEVLSRLGGPDAIEMVYDDDERVVHRLRELQYPVTHVTWMPRAQTDEQLALFDAQERQGRT